MGNWNHKMSSNDHSDPRRGNPRLRWLSDNVDTAGPCIGMLEHDSIARGIEGLDRMVKTSEIEVLLSCTVSPGKYITIITGEVEDVLASLRQAEEVGLESVVDSFLLPNLHRSVLPAIRGTRYEGEIDSLGIVETFTVASAIVAADTAAKESVVDLIDLRLANGQGGKSYFTLAGATAEVRAAVAAAATGAREKNLLVKEVVIPQVDPSIHEFLR